jgi:hypothetical protein
MTNDTECGNCGESCSEEDVAMGGICARCDEAAAEDLRAQAESEELAMLCSYDEQPFHGDRDFADLDGVRW